MVLNGKFLITILLVTCLLLYCIVQFGDVMTETSFMFEQQTHPIPYLTFLAAIITPSYRNIDKDCLQRIQNDHNRMSEIEYFLSDESLYPRLTEFVKRELSRCVTDIGLKKSKISEPVLTATSKLTSITPTIKTTTTRILPSCSLDEKIRTDGPEIDLTMEPPAFDEIFAEFLELEHGGFYPGPDDCKFKHSSVIIIPFRDRETHLRYWLHYTIPTMIIQQIRFTVIVVEQEGNGVFNKGQLMNTAFSWALKKHPIKWDCYIFHDVDMLPEVYGNMYVCDEDYVTHYAPFIDKFNYTNRAKAGVTVGGAVGFAQWQYLAVNGYPNVYWGWGGEDDDMNIRIRLVGIKRKRPPPELGRFKMVPHKRDKGNPLNTMRHKLLKAARLRMPKDGVSNLHTTITQVIKYPVYTKLLVRVEEFGNTVKTKKLK